MSEFNPKISVIIPCYNVKDCIEEAISSVSAQSMKPFEIICVDNSSSDGTLDLLKKIQAKYNLIVLEELKAGAPYARNKGLEMARGEWIKFLDADDLLTENVLERQAGLIKESSADFIAGAFKKLAVEGSVSFYSPVDSIWKGLFSTKLGVTSSNLWRKSALQEVGGWNTDLGSSQESDLMFRLLKEGYEVLVDPEIACIVRSGIIDQISSRNQVDNWKRYIELRKRILEHIKECEPELFQSEKKYFFQHLFDSIRTLAKFDLKAANLFYKELIQGNFKPSKSATTTESYLMLYGIFGFSITEKIKKLLS